MTPLSKNGQRALARMKGATYLHGTDAIQWHDATNIQEMTETVSRRMFEAIVAASGGATPDQDAPRALEPKPLDLNGHGVFAGHTGRMPIYVDPSIPPREIQIRDHTGRVVMRFMDFFAAPHPEDPTP